MKKYIYLLTCMLILSITSVAGEISPQQRIDNFFENIAQGNISTAFTNLSDSSFTEEDRNAMKELASQAEIGLKSFGKMIGYEKISEQKYGKSIIRYVYVSKYEKEPVIWFFYFYKPSNSWVLKHINFKDQITLLR